MYDHHYVFIFWQSGIWWRVHYHVELVLTDDYRSPYQA